MYYMLKWFTILCICKTIQCFKLFAL